MNRLSLFICINLQEPPVPPKGRFWILEEGKLMFFFVREIVSFMGFFLWISFLTLRNTISRNKNGWLWILLLMMQFIIFYFLSVDKEISELKMANHQ